MSLLPAIAVAALAYLIGSIPFSFLVARWFGVSDVRRVGSGNVGATNVLRSAGKGAGVLAFALDAGKGAAAAALALWVAAGDPGLPSLAAVLAVFGHMYPVWLRFKGGKGAATGLGAFAPLVPWAAALAVLAFAVVAAATRYVSLGSVVGALALAAACLAIAGIGPLTLAAGATAVLVVFGHRANLRRILRGSERQAGRPKGTS
jgi:glycerol-3-phosphate acyltransferase PlsY